MDLERALALAGDRHHGDPVRDRRAELVRLASNSSRGGPAAITRCALRITTGSAQARRSSHALRSSGVANRSFISGTRLCPPASTLASPSPSWSMPIAYARERGAS
jgi:hypothetical protein